MDVILVIVINVILLTFLTLRLNRRESLYSFQRLWRAEQESISEIEAKINLVSRFTALQNHTNFSLRYNSL